MSDHMNALLVGAGYMGREYHKVLQKQGITHAVVCRSEETALRFQNEMGELPLFGGVETVISRIDHIPAHAIVAVNVDELMETSICLIKAGVRRILVEKPGGLSSEQIKNVKDIAEQFGSEVYVAYNRRFYASVDKALEFVERDGGVTSFSFEFTEWGHKIASLSHTQRIKDAWLLANSSHVIDLAFFLGGYPKEISAFKSGKLDWHKSASKYAGAGITEKGALFSYQANWDAPGRWAIEILTKEHRLYLKPLEKLFVQEKGSIDINEVLIENEFDLKFKPGLYNQTSAFLSGNDERLLSISDQLGHMSTYEAIENGTDKY